MKVKASELKSFIAEALRAVIKESRLMEKAPPGAEDQVMALKKSLRKQHPDWKENKVVSVAMATAWKQHSGKSINESVNEDLQEPTDPKKQGPATEEPKKKNGHEPHDSPGGMYEVGATPPPVPAAAMGQRKPGTPPPVPNAAVQAGAKQKADQAATNAYQKAIQAAMQQLGPLSPEEKQEGWKKFVDAIEKEGPRQMKLPPIVEEETTPVMEVTKVTVSELRTMIRNGLKEAFGLGGEDGPTGGFESEKEEGKSKKSGTFGDGGEKKDPIAEGIKISVKALKEEINKAIQEMLAGAEEGYEAPAMREEEAMVSLEEGSLWGYKIVDVASKSTILVKEESDFPSLARSLGWKGNLVSEAVKFLDENLNKQFKDPGYFELSEGKKKLPPWLKKGKGKDKSKDDKDETKKEKGKDKSDKGKDKKETDKKPASDKASDPMAKVRAAKKS